MKHILLNRAFTYKKRKEIDPPKDFIYDSFLGAWVDKIDKKLLVLAKDFRGQGTKKCDVETGEDNKGQ